MYLHDIWHFDADKLKSIWLIAVVPSGTLASISYYVNVYITDISVLKVFYISPSEGAAHEMLTYFVFTNCFVCL
jgi:hypothetical protein